MANNNKTVAGCVRRIRKNILNAGCEGRVHCDYGELMKAFDAIEATHKSELTKKDDERLTVVATYETVIAGKDAEIAELKKQVAIAKKAFFRIAKCEHSQEVHDIFCEAEFMMNYPECRKDSNNG